MLVIPRNFLVDEKEPFFKAAMSPFLSILKKYQLLVYFVCLKMSRRVEIDCNNHTPLNEFYYVSKLKWILLSNSTSVNDSYISALKLLPTSHPSEDARMARRQQNRAAQDWVERQKNSRSS